MKFTAKVIFKQVEPSAPPPAPVSPPTLPRKIVHYAEAVVKHIATGSETRTDSEVDAILTICHTCDHFDTESSSCNLCGCRCNRQKSPFLNKLRMASQTCPTGKWE